MQRRAFVCGGLGAAVIRRARAVAVTLPGGELFTALATGAIDATEWNGPFNDMAFGLHEVAPRVAVEDGRYLAASSSKVKLRQAGRAAVSSSHSR